jgi:hypothetical protein
MIFPRSLMAGHPPGRCNPKRTKKGWEKMKLSVETEVATAITAGFIALTALAIVRGNIENQTAVPDAYGPRNNPRVNTEITEQQYNNTLQPRLWVDVIRL